MVPTRWWTLHPVTGSWSRNRVSTTSLVNGVIEMGHVKLRYCAPADTYTFQMTDIDDVVVVSTANHFDSS